MEENMNNGIAVVYDSLHGSTRRYAQWISEVTGADLMTSEEAQLKGVAAYDLVIYGSGIYSPKGILGKDFLGNASFNHLIVFTVGLNDPATTDYTEIMKTAFKGDSQAEKVFHFHGAMDYSKLTLFHKAIISMVNKSKSGEGAGKNKGKQSFKEPMDYTDRSSIEPLVEYVKSLRELDSNNM